MDFRFIYFKTCQKSHVVEVIYHFRRKQIVDMFMVRNTVNPKLFRYPNPLPEEEMKKVRKFVSKHGCRIVDENWVAIL